MSLKKEKYINHRYRIRSSTDQITKTMQKFDLLFKNLNMDEKNNEQKHRDVML